MFKFNKVQVAPSPSNKAKASNIQGKADAAWTTNSLSKAKENDEVSDGEIEALKSYFAKFDGSPNAWNAIKDLVSNILHQDFVLDAGENQVYTYKTFVPLLQAWAGQEGVSKLKGVERLPGQKKLLVSILNIPKGSPPMTNKLIFTFKDSKVIHEVIMPDDKEKLLSLINGIKQKESSRPPDIVQTLQKFFSSIDGSSDAWATIEELIPQLFDRRFKLKPDKEQLFDYEAFVSFVHAFVIQGAKAKIMSIERMQGDVQGNKLKVAICNTLKNGVGKVSNQIWTYEGSKIVQVEAFTQEDESKLGELTGQILGSAALEGSEAVTEREIDLLNTYFSKFDGCYASWNVIKEIVPQVFHPEFQFIDQHQVFEYASFVSLLHSWVNQGGKSALLAVERIQEKSQLLIIVRNTQENGMTQVTRQIVTYKGSKIIQGRAMPGRDSKKLGELVQTVLNRTDEVSITDSEIKVLELYFSKIDGSGIVTWDNYVKDLFAEVFHPDIVLLPEASQGGYKYESFNSLVREFISQKGEAELLNLERLVDDNKLQLTVRNTPHNGQAQISKQIWTYRGGKAIEVRGVSVKDKDNLASLLEEIKTTTDNESTVVAQREIDMLKTYFSRLDGSDNAWSCVKGFVPFVFHPEFEFCPDETQTYNYEPFVSLLHSWVNQGGKAELIAVERIQKGQKIMITVCNTPRGSEGKMSKQILTYQEKKVIKCVALPGEDSENLQTLVENILSKGGEAPSEGVDENQIDKLKRYFSKIDGSGIVTWNDHVKDLFAEVFHPDIVLLPAALQGGYKYESLHSLVREFIYQKGKAELLHLERPVDDDKLQLTVRNTLHNGQAQISKQIWTYRGGKAIEVRGVSDEDNDKLGSLLEGILASTADDSKFVAERELDMLKTYFSKLNGSENAWSCVKGLVPFVFHPKFEFCPDQNQTYSYEPFISLLHSWVIQGGKAELKSVERMQEGPKIMITVLNTPRNGEGKISKQILTYEGTKVVRCVALPGEDSENLQTLVKGVLSQRDESSIEMITEEQIKTLHLYFAKIDGSGISTWDEYVKDLLPQVFHPEFVFLPENSKVGQKYEAFHALVRGFNAQHGKAEILNLKRLEDGNKIQLTIRNTPYNGEEQISRQIWTYRGGKAIEIKALADEDGDKLGTLVEGVAASNVTGAEVVSEADVGMLKTCFAKLDGSEQVWDNVKDLIPLLFHPEFELFSDEKKLYTYEPFVSLVHSWISQGGKADLIDIERMESGPHVMITVLNTSCNGVGKISTQILTYRGSRVIKNVWHDFELTTKLLEPSLVKCGHGEEGDSASEKIDDTQIDILKLYFSKFDGSGIDTWKNYVKDMVPQVFHPMFILFLENSQDGLKYESFVPVLRNFVAQHGKAEILNLKRLDHGNKLLLTIRNKINNGEAQVSDQIWTYRGGKVIEIKAASEKDGKNLKALVQEVSQASGEVTEQEMAILKIYLEKLDGSANAWDRYVKDLVPQVFHKDFKFVLNSEESLNYDDFTEFAKKFAARGMKADLIDLKPLANNQLLLTTCNTHGQVDMVSTKLVTYKESKIFHVEPLPEDSKRVAALYKKVLKDEFED